MSPTPRKGGLADEWSVATYGVLVLGEWSGTSNTLINWASINSEARTGDATDKVVQIAAYGIAVLGEGASGAAEEEVDVWIGENNWLENHGTITLIAKAGLNETSPDPVHVVGIYMEGNWVGGQNSVVNTGFMDLTALGGSGNDDGGSAEAYGFEVKDWTEGGSINTLENSGRLELTATGGANSTGRAIARAYGVIGDDWTGDGSTNRLSNSGIVIARATGGANAGDDAFARVKGMTVDDWSGDYSVNTMTNTGIMELTAIGGANANSNNNDNDSSYSLAIGMESDDWSGSGSENIMENFGIINMDSRAREEGGGGFSINSSRAYGMKVEDWISGTRKNTLRNFGTLDANVTGAKSTVGDTSIAAFGIKLGELMGSSNLLENLGTITMWGTAYNTEHRGNSNEAFGIGFESANANTTIGNTGLIDVFLDAPIGWAVGIGNRDFEAPDSYRTFDGVLRNEGKIVARSEGEAEAFAIRLASLSAEDAGGRVELSTLGFLEGTIETRGQSILVDISQPSHSVWWTVENYGPADRGQKQSQRPFRTGWTMIPVPRPFS